MKLFHKKEKAPPRTPFQIAMQDNRAEVFIQNRPGLLKAPDITLTRVPEQPPVHAALTVQSAAVSFRMEAPRLSGETRVYCEEMDGMDEANRIRLHFEPENRQIYVLNPDQDSSISESLFFFRCEPDCISFFSSQLPEEAMMELKPVFNYGFSGLMLTGWIAGDWEKYLPFLCGIMQYQQLLYVMQQERRTSLWKR